MSKNNIDIWEIFTLNAFDYDKSPIYSFSCYAGDPIYISLDKLYEYGLISLSSIRSFNKFSNIVDYRNSRKFKEQYFKRAYKKFLKNYNLYKVDYEKFEIFAFWLNDFAEFMSIRNMNSNSSLDKWNIDKNFILKNKMLTKKFIEQINYEKFLQFIFFSQWYELRQYAKNKGIMIMCDLSMSCGHDSVDIWKKNHSSVDYYCDLKRNSISNIDSKYWNMHLTDRFNTVFERIKYYSKMYDILHITDRLESFVVDYDITNRGLSLWSKRALKDFFNELYKLDIYYNIVFDDENVIKFLNSKNCVYSANDLLNIINFSDNKINIKYNTVLYTSNKKDITFKTSCLKLTQKERNYIRRHFYNIGVKRDNLNELSIDFCIKSKAHIIVIRIQDLLKLDVKEDVDSGCLDKYIWCWKLKNTNKLYEMLDKFNGINSVL